MCIRDRVKAIENYYRTKKNGHNRYFFKSGELLQETVFKNNLADSIWTSYYENKAVKSRESFVEGKKQGDWLYYFDNGQIESSGKFENDQKEGEVKTFYKNGKTASVSNYCKNKLCGKLTEYYENGNLKIEKEYKVFHQKATSPGEEKISSDSVVVLLRCV